MAVRVTIGTWTRKLDPGQIHTPRSLVRSEVIPYGGWLVSIHDSQEYYDDDVLPPDEYHIMRRVSSDDAAQLRRYQVLGAALSLPVPVLGIICDFLPHAIHAEIVSPNKFGCCCCLKFEVQATSAYPTEQLGFPRCCVDPYDLNKPSKCMFYFATRVLLFGPLSSLLYVIISVILAATGACCTEVTPGGWAVRFIPCWVLYAVVFVTYFVYASEDQEYLQGDFDEGTGHEGCYVSIVMVFLYLGACAGLTVGLCYVV